MPPLKQVYARAPSMKYEFSEPLFSFSVKWGPLPWQTMGSTKKKAEDKQSLYLASLAGAISMK